MFSWPVFVLKSDQNGIEIDIAYHIPIFIIGLKSDQNGIEIPWDLTAPLGEEPG